jgi:dipeptidyl aminopeptidase/acylaminoacyl peptidase
MTPLRFLAATVSLALLGPHLGADETVSRTFTLEDLLSLERVSDSEISPDASQVAYAVKKPSVEKNTSVSHIWLVPAGGGEPRQLTNHEKGETRPRWSPDSKRIAFLSSRSGSEQLWVIAVDGGEARQLSSLSTGADGHLWSPDGKHLAFLSDVWPGLEGGDAAQKKRSEEIEAGGVKARVLDHLLYRHWNAWREGKRTHLFLVPAEGGDCRDLTPGDFDAPPFSLGGPDSFAFSPDGKEIAYTRGPVAPGSGSSRDLEAWSTNADLMVAPVAGGGPVNLSAKNPGWDGSPVWSPDGGLLAYRSQARDGYESDRFRLAVVERASGKISYPAEEIDRSVDEILWSPDGKGIYFSVEDGGRSALYHLGWRGLQPAGRAAKVLSGVHLTGLSISKEGAAAGELQSLTRPAEVATLRLEGGKPVAAPKPITRVNDGVFEKLRMPSVESIRFAGGSGAEVQAWILKPPDYQPGQRYPFLLFIHGGPQSAWQDAFSFRWNPALYASHGYVAMLPNPHGSTGFGQPFTEQISGDWPGACYQDLMKAADWAVAQGLADPARMAALGGSFGGYMVNWILGHTDRFKTLVSHAGVYNLESMYGSTEELWFPEWDLGGTPWKNGGSYEKFSPHRFAARFRTPTLVIHGEQDFRVPISEGIQLFTALKRQGVEARFLYFPDEGHWVLKPKNSKLWNETVLAWLDRFLKREPAP